MIRIYDLVLDKERKSTLAIKEEFPCRQEKEEFSSPQKINHFCREYLHLDKKAEEYVYVFGFNTRMKLCGISELSHGNVNHSICDVRSIFLRLLHMDAVNFIMVHNHPGGSPEPGKEDIAVTEKLVQASRLMDIRFLDHIIIGESYFSMNEQYGQLFR